MPNATSKRSLQKQLKNLKRATRDVVREWEKMLTVMVRQMEKRESPVAKIQEKRNAKRRKLPKVAVKYRDKRGNTWTGRGRPARWIVEAEKAGKKRESFLV
jgi:DNA-binding protein H-NS